MKNSIKTSIIAASLILAACAPEDPKRQLHKEPIPPPAPEMVVDRAKVNNQYESPKVDILFVMDNSLSMRPHQETLIANIDKFADSFIQNTDVDFHVGAVKVFDSITFKDTVPNGVLTGGFVARSADTVTDLKRILNIGVAAPNKENPASGGPEFEEIFSPIKAALTEPNLSGANAGFYRPEAHLAIIIVSDANDASPNFDETNLEAFLVALKNRRADKISVYGVVSISEEGRTCHQDPSGSSARVNNLLKNMKGNRFSLCDRSFGRKLGAVGSDIAAKAVFSRVVELAHVPKDVRSITVSCEGQVVPRDQWEYDSRAFTVALKRSYQACRADNAEIEVRYEKQKSDRIAVN
jgi:hypothetical protein